MMKKSGKTKAFLRFLVVLGILISMQISVVNTVVIAANEAENSNSAKSIQQLRIEVDTSTVSYTGKALTPEVNVYDGNEQVEKGRGYVVTYKNNVNPGKATIEVQGTGSYNGTVTRYFYIAPKKVTITSLKFNSKGTQATIKWKKDNKATGYKVYMSTTKDGNYTRIKTIKNKKTVTYTKKGLSSKKQYYFKVIAYKKLGGNQISKEYSEPITKSKALASVTLTASSSTSNRNYNLKKASQKINGLVLNPGETFDWFKVVGPASKAMGYKKASVFSNGKTIQGYGGGVCQVSTTLYQASKKLGLKIVERHQHSKPVTYTKWGNDATVSYGVQNLKIENNKNYPIRLVTSASGRSTTCKIYRVD